MAVVSFQFVASGQDAVLGAFRSIDSAAQRTARSVSRSLTSNDGPARASADRQTQAANRSADAQARAADRAADRERKALERTVVAAERAAERKARAMLRAEAQREQAAERAYRKIEQQLDREAKAAERAAARKEAASRREESARTKATAKSIVGVAGDVGSWALKGVAGLGLAAAGTVGAAAREGFQLRDITNRLSVSSRDAGAKFVSGEQLAREFENIAIKTPGQTATSVAQGAQAFVTKTGELGKARDFSETFATAASATGANVEDIANAAADLFKKFDISSIEQMQEALAALTFQGKKGAFEIKDMASQMARMASAATRFGLEKSVGGLKILGGLTQIARSATGSSEQAATAVEATMRALVAKAPDLKKSGVKVFDKKGEARDLRDVLVDSISKVGGANIERKKIGLQGIFGDEGIRAISPLITAFAEAAGKTKGTDKEKTAAGAKAVRDAFQDSIDAAGTWADVVDDASQAQRSSSARLSAAWEQLKQKASDELIPQLEPLIAKLPEFVDAMDPVIGVLKIFAEAMLDVVSFLKSKGLIQDKEKTTLQQSQEAQKRVDLMNQKLGRVGASEAKHTDADLKKAGIDPEEYKRAREQVTTLREKSYSTIGKLSMTSADFVERYAAAGDQSVDIETRKERANKIAMGALKDPDKTRGYFDFFGRLAGETKEQRGLRHNFEEQESYNKLNAKATDRANGVDVNKQAEEMVASMARVSGSLRSLGDAIDRADVGKASIAPGQ